MVTVATGRLPDFLAVGPPRTGTTWLHNVLEGHVGLPRWIKETVFFSHRYQLGMEWYESQFRHCQLGRPIGEICTYFEYPQARERIALHIPHCKIICSFRDPVERTYSYYKFMRRLAYTKLGFEDAIGKHKQMVESNRYAFHLKDWQARFGSENVLVLIYDDLIADPQSYLDRVCDFVGIERFALSESPAANERAFAITRAPRSHRLAQNARHFSEWLVIHRAYRVQRLLDRLGAWKFCYEGGEEYRPLAPDVDARIRERFRPEVEALEELIGRDLSSWKKPRVHPVRAAS